MSGLNGFARLALRLANRIAGPDRQDWLLAMAAETDAADRHGTAWALGCLYAAWKDRLARDRWFVAALLALPSVTALLVFPLGVIGAVGARSIGIPVLAAVPLMLLGPLPVAWLLGRMRPDHSIVLVGTLAFVVHQAVPLITMWALFGTLPPFWSPNMIYYNMPSYIGLIASWLVWIAGSWWGASARRSSIA
jgi:hypothetical protein